MGHNQEITSEPASVDERTLRIRALNDELRQHFRGGSLLITAGIGALPEADRIAVITAVRKFDAFDENNDPWGEHDCATLKVGAHSVMFKIDYYDAGREGMGSSDAADTALTRRVLTILLTSEY